MDRWKLMFYLFINDDSYIIVCALYRCFVCVCALYRCFVCVCALYRCFVCVCTLYRCFVCVFALYMCFVCVFALYRCFVCVLYRCFVCVFTAVMDKGQGGPPSKRRKTSIIRKPSRKAVENAQKASDPDIDNDNEVTHSLNTHDTVPLNNGPTQTINSGSVSQ